MEAAHARAVKASIVDLRTKKLTADLLPAEAAKRARNATKSVPFKTVAQHLQPATARTRTDFLDELIETAPGEYATAEAATSMGVKEYRREVLPGLAVARGSIDGSKWALVHLPSFSAGNESPHLGPVFKSRRLARETALAELAHLDWLRTTEEILGDPLTRATVNVISYRLFLAAKKRNAWAAPRLREAEEQLAELMAEPYRSAA